MKKILPIIIGVVLLISLGGCDKGIEPEPEPTLSGQTGFSGKVTFIGTWPTGITRTHLFVFKNPILSSQDFSFLNLSFVIDPIPYQSTEFSINSPSQNYIEHNFGLDFKLSPGEHSYVMVAQSKTADISFDRKDWVIVGVYCINGDQSKPKKLTILDREITTGINIVVDFTNLPPQPPM
jgi:hypothetical protein